jgi:hypothetical protein
MVCGASFSGHGSARGDPGAATMDEPASAVDPSSVAIDLGAAMEPGATAMRRSPPLADRGTTGMGRERTLTEPGAALMRMLPRGLAARC